MLFAKKSSETPLEEAAAAVLSSGGIDVAPEYGYVIIVALLTCFHFEVVGILAAMTRQKTMTQEYIDKHLVAENEAFKKEFGRPLEKGCNPDGGLGRFAAKLSFIDWVKLQNAQRAHLNYLEGLTPSMVNLLLAGLFYPLTATVLGMTTIVGRQLYTMGYRSKGPGGRVVGFQVATMSQFALMIAGIKGALHFSGVL